MDLDSRTVSQQILHLLVVTSLLIAYFIATISAKIYQNLFIYVNIIPT